LDLLSAAATLIAALAGSARQGETRRPPDPWGQAWADLARLEESVPGSPQFEAIRRELASLQESAERGAKKSRDAGATYRAQLLRAHLARLRGAPFKPVGDPGPAVALGAGEAWIALQVAGPGPTRVRALSAALAEAPRSDLPPRVERGLEATEEDARNLQLEWALAEARDLQAGAGDRRTARLLARVLRLRGETDAAAELLEEAIGAATDPGDRAALHDDLGEVRLAARDDDRAVREFGSALAMGSARAAEHLALRALSTGRIDRARALFRSLQDGAYRRNGAARAYGLALLAAPSRLPGQPPPEPTLGKP
jgi:hypothetical protein